MCLVEAITSDPHLQTITSFGLVTEQISLIIFISPNKYSNAHLMSGRCCVRMGRPDYGVKGLMVAVGLTSASAARA